MSLVDIGIDLGTTTLRTAVRYEGLGPEMPSAIAVDADTGAVMAYGEEADQMEGRTPDTVRLLRPIRKGTVVDAQAVLLLLKECIRRTGAIGHFKGFRVVMSVPVGSTEVERRMMAQAAFDIGARMVRLVEAPLAAIWGADRDKSEDAVLTVDIGGGVFETSVITPRGVLLQEGVRIGGDHLDGLIADYVREKHHFDIGLPTARAIKLKLGCAMQRDPLIYTEVSGRDKILGLPRYLTLDSDEIMRALDEPVRDVWGKIASVEAQTPGEWRDSLKKGGILLTGGGASLWGLDRRLALDTGLPCELAEDPQHCVIRGILRMMEENDLFDDLSHRAAMIRPESLR